jgi:adrenodoxin-NADP+ reductase
VLNRSRVVHISVVGRRGHVQAAFTIKELRELTRLQVARCTALTEELDAGTTPASLAELEAARSRRRQVDLIRTLASPTASAAGTPTAPREVALRFLLMPRAILPDPKQPSRVGSLVLERSRLEGPAGRQVAVPTGQTLELKCDLVLRSIGYRSEPIRGVPFDPKRAVVANSKGRIVDGDKPVSTTERNLPGAPLTACLSYHCLLRSRVCTARGG